MRKWSYTSAIPSLERNLNLSTTSPLPIPKPTEHLLRVLAVALNPVDYKPAEAPLLGRLLTRLNGPTTPGFDVAGSIIAPASGSDLKTGTLVYGAASSNPLAGGGLADYIAVPATTVATIPPSLSPTLAAGFPVAALTAYASLAPYIKPGHYVFLNGGSGGVGTFGIQIAKVLGAHVTVSCSGANAQLCRDLGADDVLDYAARPLLHQLQEAVEKNDRLFDHVVDNVFSDPELYFKALTYTSADARFVEVASGPSLAFLRFALGAFLVPGFLGGGKRKFVLGMGDVRGEKLEELRGWIEEGRVRTVVDGVWPMEKVAEAFGRLKTGRARGKVLVDVAGENEGKA
ncbi:hypothetical protein WHR41_08718 [Cladosporium halotolerans]|uniref:Enoyl reductase (ER) domain-containing protein n=1 Tax=Cladosporium halotolerans TaxID=1052096 RepID=A0AB34KFI9_9PEZI